MTTDLAQVYQAADKIVAGTDKEESFLFLLECVKGSEPVKQLAAQFIPQFFLQFPQLTDRAIEAEIDLCEDDKLEVRVYAIRGLEQLCRGAPQHLQRIADVLGQLLVADEAIEIQTLRRAFSSLFVIDPKACFTELFKHAREKEETGIREKAITFLDSQVKSLEATIDKSLDLQNHIFSSIQKALSGENVKNEEFEIFLGITKRLKTLLAQQHFATDLARLLEIYASIPALPPEEKEKEASEEAPSETVPSDALEAYKNAVAALPIDEKYTSRFLSALKHLLPLLPKGGVVDGFLRVALTHLLPSISRLPEPQRLDLLKLTAEASKFASNQTAADSLPFVHQALKVHIPLPTEKQGDEEKKEETTESQPADVSGIGGETATPQSNAAKPKINLSHVECLLYVFHQLSAKAPHKCRDVCGIFVPSGQPWNLSDEVAQSRRDFMARLDYLEQHYKGSIDSLKKLAQTITGKIRSATDKAEQNTLSKKRASVQGGIKTVANMQKLVGCLKKKVPEFLSGRTAVQLSWQSSADSNTGLGARRILLGTPLREGKVGGNKVRVPSDGKVERKSKEEKTEPNGNRKRKADKGIQFYAPPSRRKTGESGLAPKKETLPKRRKGKGFRS